MDVDGIQQKKEMVFMMRTTRPQNFEDNLAVSGEGLARILDCGRATAVRIGIEAGARMQIGRRVLYNVDAVRRYLNESREV